MSSLHCLKVYKREGGVWKWQNVSVRILWMIAKVVMLAKSKLNSVESTISKFGKTILEKKICHQTVSYGVAKNQNLLKIKNQVDH